MRPGGHEPVESQGIAIVGMAGRFPGAGDVDAFWENLEAGRESITRLTPEQLAAAGVDPALAASPRYVAARPLLDGIDRFDADLFGVTPREAEMIDPQQRVFLEQAYAALEDSGHDPARFAGQVGVYAGTSLNSYLLSNLLASGGALDAAASFQALTASDKDYLATRISYKLDLRGPSLAVQTACSTSLVALHLACESLHAGESDLALAGGVSISVPQAVGYVHYEGGIYSRDGRCRPFDAAASGTLFGSGAGVVVLKRLEDALADGDRIRAVVLGSAINNDGSRKVGYTAPGVDGQAEVIAEALEVAAVEPATIGSVEAHGTATPMGDPIEVKALVKAFGGERLPEGSCALGSVKSNFGHLEAAAGVAGLIKSVLALEHGTVPPSLHFERPNPAIRFGPFRVADRRMDFPRTAGAPRRAGVSSFGIGGTNAHVVLEEAPAARPRTAVPAGPEVLVVSAHTASALAAMEERLAARLEAADAPALTDAAHTLQVGRPEHPHRRFLVARSAAEAAAALRGGAGRRGVRPAGYRPVAFLLPGQGAQHPGMGADLYRAEPAFRREMDRASEVLAPALGLHLARALYPGLAGADGSSELAQAELAQTQLAQTELAQTELAQPALLAVELATAALWRERGIEPEALLGHSVGELAAAALAGVFSFEDALALSAVRGRLMAEHGSAGPAGALTAVAATAADLAPFLAAEPEVGVAAENADDRLTVAGPEAAVERLSAALSAAGLRPRRLDTSHAFHTAAMEGAVEPFVAEVRRSRRSAPEIPFLSNVTGAWITDAEAVDPEYWGRQIRRPVRFAAGLAELLASGSRVLLEVGPGHTLTRLARRAGASDRAAASMPDPRQGSGDGAEALAEAAGRLWLAGVDMPWESFAPGDRRRVGLPTYPFEGESHWVEAAPREARGRAGHGADGPEAGDLERQDDPGRFFHLPVWRGAPRPVPPESLAGGRWLLLGSGERSGPLAERLAEELERRGASVRRAETAGGYEDLLAAEARGEARRDAEGEGPLHLVHLASLDDAAGGADEAACFDLFALGRALAVAPSPSSGGRETRLTVLSRGLFRVTGDEALSPERATLLGPCQTLPGELPGLACRVVDVDEATAARHADRLAAELTAGDAARPAGEPGGEPVAWRRGLRFRRAFEAAPLPAAPPQEEAGLNWLVTGGFGGIGRTLAERLAATPGVGLALLGRRAPAADDPFLAGLEAKGARVLALAADVTDPDALTAAVAEARRALGPIGGVVHAAGVAGGSVVARTDDAAAREVMAPKVAGTRNLAAAVAGDPVRHFVLCSSLLSLAGMPGQAAYAAGNAFLDAFAHREAAEGGLPAVAVDWGPWQEVGMAAAAAKSAPKLSTTGAAAGDAEGTDHGASPLLGPVTVDGERRTAHGRLDPESQWVLAEHRVMGRPVLPGTAYLDMAARLAEGGGEAVELADVLFLSPLAVSDGGAEVRAVREGSAVRVESRAGASEPWREHARMAVRAPSGEARTHDLTALRAACPEEVDAGSFRTGAEAPASPEGSGPAPIEWGPRWRSVRRLHRGEGTALAEIELAPELAGDLDAWRLHPALFDAAGGFASRAAGDGLFLPFSYGRVRLHRPLPARFFSWVRRRDDAPSAAGAGAVACFDLTLLDPEGRELVSVESYCLRRVDAGADAPAEAPVESPLGSPVGSPVGSSGQAPVETRVRLTPAEGAEAFLRLLGHPPGEQVAVVPVDLTALLRRVAEAARGGGAAREAAGGHRRPDVSAPFVAPRSEVEERLAEIWSRRLGIARVGAEDNFFELGGDSVVAIQVIADLNDAGFALRPEQLFQNPTLEGLAARAEEGESGDAPEAQVHADDGDDDGFDLADLDAGEMAGVLARFGGEEG